MALPKTFDLLRSLERIWVLMKSSTNLLIAQVLADELVPGNSVLCTSTEIRRVIHVTKRRRVAEYVAAKVTKARVPQR